VTSTLTKVDLRGFTPEWLYYRPYDWPLIQSGIGVLLSKGVSMLESAGIKKVSAIAMKEKKRAEKAERGEGGEFRPALP
jgi:hypothetical protein